MVSGAKTGIRSSKEQPIIHGIPLCCPKWLAQPFLDGVRGFSFKEFKQLRMPSPPLLPETAATIISHIVLKGLSGHQMLSSKQAASSCMF